MPRRRDTEIRFEFFVDVAQAWWDVDAVGDREGKSVGLPRSVIGVLAKDHDPGVGVGGQMKRSKDLLVRWVDRVGASLGCDEGLEFAPVVLVELVAENGVPVGRRRHRRTT